MAEKKTDLAAALLTLSEGLSSRAMTPGRLSYKPLPKQLLFHKSDSYVRLYLGGNRGGKTHAGVMEDIWWALGTHPYLTTPPPPVRIRVIVVDFIRGLGEIMIPKFKSLVLKSDLKGGSWDKAYNKEERKITFANDSEIQFMSYEQDLDKFAGTSLHLIHFDEEPPQHIYNENAARVVDTNGKMFITMTPVEGITWVYEEIYNKTLEADDVITIVHKTNEIGGVYRSNALEYTVVEVGMNENTYLDSHAQKRFLNTLTEEERAARSKGTFVSVGGKVFKDFDRKTHVVPSILNPREVFGQCYIYTSTDHGWNNPTAWLWHAVFPDGRVVTFHEHYAREMTIREHSEIVHAYEKKWNLEIEVRTGDPAMGQHSAITGTSVLQEYSNNGINIYTDSVPKDPSIGIAKMMQYFRPVGEIYGEDGMLINRGAPMWVITEDCVNFIKELSNLQWQKYESRKLQFKNNKQEAVQKKDDHAFDSAKYFATFLPDLRPEALPSNERLAALKNLNRYNGTVRYDEALVREVERREGRDTSQWETLETFS